MATACGQSCMHPVKVPGECCPVCEEPTYITIDPPACGELSNCTLKEKDCVYGFKLDHNGCRTCQCKNREERCLALKRACTLDCPFGFLTDVHNCELCQCRPRPKKCRPTICDKFCPLGFLRNKHGCDICRCKKCPELPCSKVCPLGFQEDSHGCLICKCREVPTSAGPPVLSGTCLSMDGHHHKNEESWHDGCRECYCHNGKEMCALITCPVPACGNPTIRPGQCCPSCADDFVVQKPELSTPSICHAPGGEYFVEGETWNIDSCTQCTCHSGRVLCETEVCPPLLCQNPHAPRTPAAHSVQRTLFSLPHPIMRACLATAGMMKGTSSWRPSPGSLTSAPAACAWIAPLAATPSLALRWPANGPF